MRDRQTKPIDFTSQEPFRKDRSPEKRETQKKPPILAHAFVLQSASPEFINHQIEQGIPLKDLQFSHNVLAHHKDPEKETVFSPLGIVPIQPNEYELSESDKKVLANFEYDIKEQFFASWYVRGTPYKILYAQTSPISPKAQTHVLGYTHTSPFDTLEQPGYKDATEISRCDLGTMRKLLADTQGITVNTGKRHSKPTLPIPDTARGTLLEIHEEAEKEKKLQVIKALLHLYTKELKISAKERNELESKIKSIEALPSERITEALESAERLYQDFLDTHTVASDQLVEAVRLANLTEELKLLDTYTDKFETVIRFLMLLPELKSLPKQGFEVLKESEIMGPYITSLLEKMSPYGDIGESIDIALQPFRKKVERLDARNDDDNQKAKQYIQDLLGIPIEEYYTTLEAFNELNQMLSFEGISQQVGEQISMSLFEHLNEVARANPVQLLQMALRVGPTVDRYTKISNATELVNRLVFEAQSKLFVMSAIRRITESYERKLKQGHDEFNQVWDTITSGPSHEVVLYTIRSASNGAIENIITDRDPQLLEAYRKKEKQGKVSISSQEDLLRELHIGEHKVLVRVTERYIKPRASTILKSLLTGQEPLDEFGREIIIVSDIPDLIARETRTMEVKRHKDLDTPDQFVTENRTFDEHAIVFGIIDMFRRQLNLVLDPEYENHRANPLWTCDVLYFKPTPKNEGGTFASERKSGGGKIRMSKLYLMVENSRRNFRGTEELQIFIPTADKISGLAYYAVKKEDDNRYRKERIAKLQTGLRSLLELFKPLMIYPRITEVFRKGGTKKKK